MHFDENATTSSVYRDCNHDSKVRRFIPLSWVHFSFIIQFEILYTLIMSWF